MGSLVEGEMGAPARRFVRGPTAQKAADVEGRDCRPTGRAGRVLYKLLLNGTSVEVANGRDVRSQALCWCASWRSARLPVQQSPTEVPMRRIGLAVVLSLVLAPLGVKAQPTRNVHPIGFLGPTPSAGGLVQVAFRDIRALTIWVSPLACGRASCERPAARVLRALVRPSRSPSAAPCGRSRRRRRAVGSRDRRRARRLPARRPGASSRSRCPARGAARATHSAARAAHRFCRRACPPRRDHRACSGLGSGVAKARSWRVFLYATTRLPSSPIGSVPGW